jgi:L-xylulokinase
MGTKLRLYQEGSHRIRDGSRSIAGVGVYGHGKGLYPWGEKQQGWPITVSFLPITGPDSIRKNGKKTEPLIPSIPDSQILACQPVSLLAWLRDHERDVYDSIKYVFSVTDYIRFHLSGEAWSKATNSSGSGLMNIRDARFDRDMLEAFDIAGSFDMLPPVRYSGEPCGAVSREAAGATGLILTPAPSPCPLQSRNTSVRLPVPGASMNLSLRRPLLRSP